MTTILFGVGAALLLIGVNGRKLSGFNIAGSGATMAEFEKDEQVKSVVKADTLTEGTRSEAIREVTQALQPGEGSARVLTVGNSELVRVGGEQVPPRVLIDLASGGAPVRSSADVNWGARRVDRDGYTWYVQLKNGKAYRASYEGAENRPTVAEVKG